ncbi:MAG TPA: hypothetical protein VMV16_08130 [Solirubrobacteraceae bacterium]|nr:hypothetical protein [Solirubrobacteraceae bacterium]
MSSPIVRFGRRPTSPFIQRRPELERAVVDGREASGRERGELSPRLAPGVDRVQ